jgi:hypothetical protein
MKLIRFIRFIILTANHSYADRDHSAQETDAIESQAKGGAPLSAPLFAGYSTLAAELLQITDSGLVSAGIEPVQIETG